MIFFLSLLLLLVCFFFFSSRRRHTRSKRDWSSDVCSSDLFEESLLLDLKFGITNIVERATARADELTDDELRAGGHRLRSEERRVGKECRSRWGTEP